MKLFRKKNKADSSSIDSNLEERLEPSADRHAAAPNSPNNDLSVSLRAEMLPSSAISPDVEAARFSKFNPRKLLAVLGFIILLALGWFLYAGPGRPALEQVLSGIINQPKTVLPATPTPVISTEVAAVPTNTVRVVHTPTRISLPLPSATASVIQDTPTSEVLPSETPSSDCVDVLTITLEDVGKTLCVRGVILNFEERTSGFLIAFSNQEGAMFWVSYDLVWLPAKEGLCVEVTGEVMQIANSPVIVFGYHNLPVICSTP